MTTENHNALEILRQLNKVDVRLSGEAFIKEMVRHIAQDLKMSYVLVGRAVGDSQTQIQTDFVWSKNDFVANISYDLLGTPCREVICDSRVKYFATGVSESFAEDKLLKDLKVEAYLGAPFLNAEGRLIGILVVMHDQELHDLETLSAIIDLCAARIGVEYRRMIYEESLRKVNEKLEEEVRQQTMELRTAFENLQRTQNQLLSQEKLATIGRITFGIAHELKNPLNVIINSAEIIDDLPVNDEDQETRTQLTRMIRKHGERANEIISSMLKQAREDSDREVGQINISQLILHSLDMCTRSLSDIRFKESLVVSKNIKDNIILTLNGPASLERAFINIFDNSMYALKKKWLQLGASSYHPKLSVEAQCHENKLEVLIRDNGTGVPDKFKLHIFDEFFTTKPSGDGTGLGLSIAKATFIENSGDIQLKSQEGLFTEIRIELPMDCAGTFRNSIPEREKRV